MRNQRKSFSDACPTSAGTRRTAAPAETGGAAPSCVTARSTTYRKCAGAWLMVYENGSTPTVSRKLSAEFGGRSWLIGAVTTVPGSAGTGMETGYVAVG